MVCVCVFFFFPLNFLLMKLVFETDELGVLGVGGDV